MGVTVAALCTLLLIDTMEECRGGCDMVYRAKGRGVSGPADKRDGASRVVSFQLGELYAEHGGLVGFTRLDRTLSGTRWLASAIVGWRSRGGVPLSPQRLRRTTNAVCADWGRYCLSQSTSNDLDHPLSLGHLLRLGTGAVPNINSAC